MAGVSKTKTEDRRPKTEDRRPKTEDRRPKTEDRRLGNQLNEMCWNAKQWNRLVLRFVDLPPPPNYNTKTFAKTLYLTLKNWNRWGLRVVVLSTSNYKMDIPAKTLKSMGSSFCSFTSLKLQSNDPRWNVLFDVKTLKTMRSSFCSFTSLKLQKEDPL